LRFREPSGHQNPDKRFENRSDTVSSANVGAFELGPRILTKLDGGDGVPVDTSVQERARQFAGPQATVAGGQIYIGPDPTHPQTGDMRISYHAVRSGALSVIGAQTGNSVDEYQTKSGDRLLMIAKDVQSADSMFALAHQENRIKTWTIRGLGLLAMFVGFVLVLNPFPTLASVLPFLGSLVGFGMMLISLVLTALLGSVTIAIGWLFYRPLLGIGLLVVVGAAIAGVVYLKRSKPDGARPAPALPGVSSGEAHRASR
jgi:Transmembrane protein 43